MAKGTKVSPPRNQSGKLCIAHEECANAHFSKEEPDDSVLITWGESVRGVRVYNLFENNSQDAINKHRRLSKGNPDVLLIDNKFYVEY
jgi:hypothetical protein